MLEGKSFSIHDITIDVLVKHIVNNLNDWRFASCKVDEIGKLINEQQWKFYHSNQVNKYDLLSFLLLQVLFWYLSFYAVVENQGVINNFQHVMMITVANQYV